MDDSGFSGWGILEEYAGGLLTVLTVTGASIVLAWLRSRNINWATFVLDVMVGWICLYILLQVFTAQTFTAVPVLSFSWWMYLASFGVLALFLFLDWRRRQQTAVVPSVATAPAIPLAPPVEPSPRSQLLAGYDRLIPARKRGGIEEELDKAKEVWFAAIGGAHLPQLKEEQFRKITRVILVNPDSEYMKMLSQIQEPRASKFPNDVIQAAALCKKYGVKFKVSNHPIMNIVICDPYEPHAWVRWQGLIPYFLGQDSPVFAVRNKDWPEMYTTIRKSFEKTWEEAKGWDDRNR